MKTNKIFAAIVFGFVACATSVNAQTQNEVKLNDFKYKASLMEKRFYVDHYLYSYEDDPNEYANCVMQKHGPYIGIQAGVQNFDGHTVPNVGGVLGWEGKHIGFEYDGTFAKGDYTSEADRSNSYVEFDSRLVIKGKLLDNNSHSWQLWVGLYGSYKLNFDYHENNSTVTTVRETDSEIVTTIDKLGSNYEFKGSTMGAGVQLELVYRPYMSKFNFRLTVSDGAQQRFYDDGNGFLNEFSAQFKVTYNFNAQKIWDGDFLKNTGFSKKQVKQYNKKRTQRIVQWL